MSTFVIRGYVPLLHVGGSNGISIYRGVVVEWDGDHDPRILTMIDEMADDEREQLMIAGESKGSLSLTWYTHIPEGWEEQGAGRNVEGDNWSIWHSEVFGSPRVGIYPPREY